MSIPSVLPTPVDGLAYAQQLVNRALLHAQADEWDQVAELDQQCRAAVEALMAQRDAVDFAPLIAPLNYLLECHRNLLELAEAKRTAIVHARRQSIYARQSVKIYQS